MHTANHSSVFGLKTNKPVSSVHDFRKLNSRNAMLGVSLANAKYSQLSPYSRASIELIASRCAEDCKEVTSQQFKWITHVMECLGDFSSSKEIEASVCNVLSHMEVSNAPSVVRDSAIALALSRMMVDCSGHQIKVHSDEQIARMLEESFVIFGLSCYIDGIKVCDGKRIFSDSNAKALAQISLGLVPGENKAAAIALSGNEPTDLTEAVAVLTTADVQPNVGRFLLTQYALSGLWPIDAQWIVSNPYYYGDNQKDSFGALGSLGALDDKFSWENESEKPPQKPSANPKGDWSDEAKSQGVGVVGDILKTLTSVGGKYLESQIKQAEAESTLDLRIKAAKALGLESGEVSDSEVIKYAKENPKEAKYATENALKNAGVDGSDIKQMMAMLMAQSNKKNEEPEDKTMMYVAIGAGVLAVAGIAAFAVSRR